MVEHWWFFHCQKPLKALWQYVLLFDLYGSDIAHNLKNDWSYMLLMGG
jgi:hypothetical protein